MKTYRIHYYKDGYTLSYTLFAKSEVDAMRLFKTKVGLYTISEVEEV